MFDPTIGGIAAAISALANLGKSIADTSDAAKRNSQLIEFQQALIKLNGDAISMQTQNSSLRETNKELEQKIVSLKDWEAEKQKYELREVAYGVFAQVEKGFVGNFASAHKYCAQCFENNIKAILQTVHDDKHIRLLGLACQNASCRSKITFHAYADNENK